MHWKFPINFMGGAQEQQDIPTQSWYPPSVVSSSSRPSTPGSSSGVGAHQRASDRPQSPSHGQPSPAEAAEVRDELRRETLRLARENLEKEPRILELRNQCTIIRTTELAAAQEKLADLEKQMEELMRSYAPSSLLQKLHDAINTVEEESEALNMQFIEKEVDLPTFVQKYKKLRNTYHRMALLHLAAKTTVC